MAFKFIAFATLVAAASAGLLPATPVAYQAAHAVPVAYTHGAQLAYAAPVAKTVDADYDPNPQYSYSYDVHDSLTGDAKSQHETRNGDVVEGSYSLVEADGSRRVVHYTADDHNGFNAVVEKQPAQVAVKAVAVKAVAPVAYAHPVAYQHASPVLKVAAPVAHATYAAPVAHATYAAPVAHATYAAPTYAAHATYAAPAYAAHATYAAPAYAAHATYAAPVAHATYAAPIARATYAAPAYAAHGYAAPALTHSYYH